MVSFRRTAVPLRRETKSNFVFWLRSQETELPLVSNSLEFVD